MSKFLFCFLFMFSLFPSSESSESIPNEDQALQFLVQGNEFSGQGRHLDAIYMWQNASILRPDSNVPWNNIANAFMSLEKVDDALVAAQRAFEMKVDYLSSTTLSNVQKAMKQYREAEETLLTAIEMSLKYKERLEHPFWSLASLYYEQGDYLEFIKYSEMGLNQRPGVCQDENSLAQACAPDFENVISRQICNVSLELGVHDANHGAFDSALHHFQRAEDYAKRLLTSPRAKAEQHAAASLAGSIARHHTTCIRCLLRGAGDGECTKDLEECRRRWGDLRARYLLMLPGLGRQVRAMGCDWRHRRRDELDLARVLRALAASAAPPGAPADDAASSDPPGHLHAGAAAGVAAAGGEAGVGEFLFECSGGLVCGVGAVPPLYVWGLPMGLDDFRRCGELQAREMAERSARWWGVAGGPAAPPHFAHPAWGLATRRRFVVRRPRGP